MCLLGCIESYLSLFELSFVLHGKTFVLKLLEVRSPYKSYNLFNFSVVKLVPNEKRGQRANAVIRTLGLKTKIIGD